MEEKDTNEVSFLDVTVYDDGTSKIEVLDNGGLEEVLALAIIKDERLHGLMIEVFVKYLELTSDESRSSIKKVN